LARALAHEFQTKSLGGQSKADLTARCRSLRPPFRTDTEEKCPELGGIREPNRRDPQSPSRGGLVGAGSSPRL